MKTLKTYAAAAAMMALASTAQASLINRGNGMIYDTVGNITWLADMNYAKTSGYTGTGVNATTGTMKWAAATLWANNLVYGGVRDWRLPTLNTSDTSCSNSYNPGGGFPQQHYGYNCTGGELGHLFITDLGNKGGESVLNQAGDTAEQIANLALFSNVQSNFYWSGTEYAPIPSVAWVFGSDFGVQNRDDESRFLYAVAVRPGDVAAAVPEPQTLALALLALGAMAVVRRRRPG
jgi:MYXO-CTERM domain-containing protein